MLNDDSAIDSPKPSSGGVDMEAMSGRFEPGMEYVVQILYEMKAEMREMKADIREVRGDIQRLSDKTDLRFERVNERIDQVNTQLNNRIDAQRGWYLAIIITIMVAFVSIFMTQG